jgi:hypothetical protein
MPLGSHYMLTHRRSSILLAACIASTLAGCCHGPLLSYRYGESGGPFPLSDARCDNCGRHAHASGMAAGCPAHGHLPLLVHLPKVHPPVVSNQRADYVSPTPKYHPVPTRPVFEAQPEYPPAHPLAGPVPRRRIWHDEFYDALHHHPPAQPISEPAPVPPPQ